MALKTKKKSLADKINSLITTIPTSFGSDDEAEDTKAKVVDYHSESDASESNVQVSKIRRRNVDTLDQLDERYKGKKVSRKDLYSNDSDIDSSSSLENEDSIENGEDEEMENDYTNSDDELSNEDENDDDLSKNGSNDNNESNSEEQSEASESQSDIESDNYDIYNDNNFDNDEETEPQFKTISDTNVSTDISKGNCVRSQLKLWESLLEMRIKLQKCLITSNQMPQHNVHKNFRADSEFMKKTNETTSKLAMLLNSMLQLQDVLLRQYPETKNLNTQNKKRKLDDDNDKEEGNDDLMDEEIPSDTEDEEEIEETKSSEDNTKTNILRKRRKLIDYEKMLNDNHKSYADYRDSVIQKWNEKTRLATGKVNKSMNHTTLKQVEFALSDKEKLRKKTQLKRSEYKIVGKMDITDNDNDGKRFQEYDPEIYDDDDFYHQLLRDLIEYKSSGVTDPIQLSKQWIQLQNMRNKMKRKIDTRATKGRRIRFNVHNKLVNFMAPITVNDTWMDHAKDELYNSLFGKIKSTEGEVSH